MHATAALGKNFADSNPKMKRSVVCWFYQKRLLNGDVY